MTEKNVEREYFEWMFNLVCEDRYGDSHLYRKLLSFLHDVEFTYFIKRDFNRASDGIDLRRRFAADYRDAGIYGVETYLKGPCSVLEMMIALSIRCETIMDDPAIGDRTAQWFWKMIVNLGFGSLVDDRFNIDLAEDIIARFLNREYDADGRGGLFRVRGCEADLRDVEIWTQMCWYLDTIIRY